jgi:hypothetical protein
MSALKWLYMKSSPVSPAISGPAERVAHLPAADAPDVGETRDVVAGNCPDPPCSLFVLGGERNGSEDILDRDAEEVGPGWQHPVVAGRSVIQERSLACRHSCWTSSGARSGSIRWSFSTPSDKPQGRCPEDRRQDPSPRGRLLSELAVGPIRRAGSLRLDGAGDGNEPALSAWEVSAVARR